MFILGNYRGYKSTLKSKITIKTNYKMALASKLGQISACRVLGVKEWISDKIHKDLFCRKLNFQQFGTKNIFLGATVQEILKKYRFSRSFQGHYSGSSHDIHGDF